LPNPKTPNTVILTPKANTISTTTNTASSSKKRAVKLTFRKRRNSSSSNNNSKSLQSSTDAAAKKKLDRKQNKKPLKLGRRQSKTNNSIIINNNNNKITNNNKVGNNNKVSNNKVGNNKVGNNKSSKNSKRKRDVFQFDSDGERQEKETTNGSPPAAPTPGGTMTRAKARRASVRGKQTASENPHNSSEKMEQEDNDGVSKEESMAESEYNINQGDNDEAFILSRSSSKRSKTHTKSTLKQQTPKRNRRSDIKMAASQEDCGKEDKEEELAATSTTTEGTTRQHKSPGEEGEGLLSGIHNVNSLVASDGYTDRLPWWSVLQEPSVFWDAVQQDIRESGQEEIGEGQDVFDTYCETLRKRFYQFNRSKRVAGRHKLQTILKQHVDSDQIGQILLLTGGRRIGKSKLLNEVCSNTGPNRNSMVVAFINGREATFANGLASALYALDQQQQQQCAAAAAAPSGDHKQLVTKSVWWKSIVTKLLPFEQQKQVWESISLTSMVNGIMQGREDVEANLVKLFVVIAEQLGKRPYVIVDEAEEVFLGEAGNRKLSNTLTYLTKTTMQLSLILCSSHPSFQRGSVGDFPLHLMDVFHVPELSPKEMWDFLTLQTDEETGTPLIGMGKNLARHSIAAFGGNLTLVDEALKKLVEAREDFSPYSQLLWKLDGAMSVKKLLEEEDIEVVRMLRRLAVTGYLSLDNFTTKSAKIIEEANIGIMLSRISEYPLKLSTKKQRHRTVLVPSSLSIRHVIAQHVKLIDARKKRVESA